MMKIGRNSPCPCGSGKKYKRCCHDRDAKLREAPLPSGRFIYKHGSYGGPGFCVPSILCYKETAPNQWDEHFCLVKPDAVFDEEDSASALAEEHLAQARAIKDGGGSAQDFALSLRHKGYKSVSDFRIARSSEGV